MEIKEMEVNALLERRNAIATELDSPEANLNALEEEVRAINAELESRKQKAKEEAEERAKVAEKQIETVVIEKREEETKMENIEVRNSMEYINAFANYIKSNDDSECRALISENGTNGQVPIPELVYEEVKRAWDEDGIMSLVRKTYVKGNLKVGFEISSTGAVVHAEGGDAVNEETLILGTVNLIPANIKKWISVSDEVMALRGEAFLQYVYRELAHQIAKKAGDELLAKINACGTASTSTCVGVPVISTTIGQATIADALGQLSDEASKPVVVMNKATWSAFKSAQYSGNFNADIFEGLPVVFNNSLTAYTVATTGDTYAIVGDFGYGAIANFPEGEELRFNFDDKTLATRDLVRIIAREYVAMEPVAPKAFVKIQK